MSCRLQILRRAAAAALALSLSFAGAPATAQAQSRAEPQRAEMLQSMGGALEGPITDYVNRIGQKMAQIAGQGGRCRFTVINTDGVNAFAAPPGCDIYVTRGLLGLVRNEAELAGVLGHEIGHVTANHSARRQTRSAVTGLGAILLGAVTGSDMVGKIAGQAAQLNVLSYSRTQEFEADSLGVGYLRAAGYSPYGLAGALSALQANDQVAAQAHGVDAETALPAWSRTHPLTGERIARVAQAAQATGLGRNDLPEAPEPYLAAIDGLIWGDDPAQGLVDGPRFAHAGLGVGFAAPPGFTLANNPSAVGIRGPDGARGQFIAGRAAGRTLEDLAYQTLQQLIGQAPNRIGRPQRSRINGVDAVILPAQAQSTSGVVDVTVAAYAPDADTVYEFVTLAPRDKARVFDPLFASFHRLSAPETAALRARRIKVVETKPGDTSGVLAARMAVDSLALEQFRAINGLSPGEEPREGDKVKLVVR